jgi:hypothetical protein
MTMDTSSWINAGMDLVSGYYDPLDQFVDNLAMSSPDLGRAAVDTVLKAAGSVPLPPLPGFWQEQQAEAGVLG